MTYPAAMEILSTLVTATGTARQLGSQRAYQGTVRGTGVVTATIIVEGSNDGITFHTIMTFTLNDTTVASAAAQANSNWKWTRARCTAITGTGARAKVFVSSSK